MGADLPSHTSRLHPNKSRLRSALEMAAQIVDANERDELELLSATKAVRSSSSSSAPNEMNELSVNSRTKGR